MGSWIDQELAGCRFADARLGKWFGSLMGQLSQGIGRTIPLACGDWVATKAAYRFLDNDRVSEGNILAGHLAATRERFDAVEPPGGRRRRSTSLVALPARSLALSSALFP